MGAANQAARGVVDCELRRLTRTSANLAGDDEGGAAPHIGMALDYRGIEWGDRNGA